MPGGLSSEQKFYSEDEMARLRKRIDRHIDDGYVVFERDLAAKVMSCGIDIHRDFVSVAILDATDGNRRVIKVHFQEFLVNAQGLDQMLLFLTSFEMLQDIAIEATANYWRPIHHVLSGTYNVVVVNPKEIKNYEKSDVKDSILLAELMMIGHLRPSFIPDQLQFGLRLLTRQRKKLVQHRTAYINRINSVLLSDNIIVGNVIKPSSATMNKIVRAIIEGERDETKLAQLCTNVKEREKLVQKLQLGLTEVVNIKSTTVFVLAHLIDGIDVLNRQIESYDLAIDSQISSYEITDKKTGQVIQAAEIFELLKTIPAWGRLTAQTYIAEVGIRVSHWPTAGHLSSFCGFNPQKKTSAGKVVSNQSKKGNVHIHSAVVQVAHLVLQGKTGPEDRQLSEYAWNYLNRPGSNIKKAIGAVGHRMIYGSWFVVNNQEPWNYSKYSKTSEVDRQIKNLQKLRQRLADIELITTTKKQDQELEELRKEAAMIASSMLGYSDIEYVFVEKTTNRPLDELEIPKRVKTALLKNNFQTTGDVLMAIFNKTLIDSKGIGQKSLQALIEALIKEGYIARKISS